MSRAPELAVILAAGRGTRMMAGAGRTPGLAADQRLAAADGQKALMPIGGRPFVAWVVDALAQAGYREICLVLSPDTSAPPELALPTRVAVQPAPLGTAAAVLAAETIVAQRSFIVINGDNWYPPDALRLLATAPPPATIGFPQAERVEAFALLGTDPRGCLATIAEKPDPVTRARLGDTARVSMTCWSFTPAIFAACRAIAPSPRGERELSDAVRHVAATSCVRVLDHGGPVLDLSRASDIPVVAARLGA